MITHLLSAEELEMTMSYLLKSKLSKARGLSVRANLCDLFSSGIFCMKLVVIFLHLKIGFSCCQKIDVKISALGNISNNCLRTSSAPHQSFIQSQTMATRLFFNFK